MKARFGVTNTGRPRVRTIMNLALVSEGPSKEAYVSVASRRAAKREKC
jgi:hypothetical protein